MQISILALVGIGLATMFFGYFFGLFEGRGQGYKKRRNEEASDPELRAAIASGAIHYAGYGINQLYGDEAGREFKLLARNELGERITASPAISGDELIYRTDSHLYSIGQASGKRLIDVQAK